MERFRGRIALITGAGSGIGRATARRLEAEGATVVAGILDRDQAAAVAGLDAQVMDVRREVDWDRVMRHVEDRHGGLDVLINNAGIHRLGTASDTDRALWDEVMEVNLWGTFLGCRQSIEAFRRRGRGAIVNLASIASIRGVPNQVAYNTSKGGIQALTMALALDHAGEGIRINCVCPGAVQTPIIEQIVAAADDPARRRAGIAAGHPLGRMATPEEVAAVIAFLASDDAAFMTGLSVPVDGGRSVR